VLGTGTLRVIVADDDPLSRRTVRDALQAAGITVIAEAGDGREAVELALHYAPDIVLIEADLPVVDGLEATRRIHARATEVKVIVHAAVDDPELALRSLRAGASGFLPKRYGLDSLARALRAADAGEAIVPRHIAGHLVECLRRAREHATGLRPVRSSLTDREWEVLDLLCQDLSTAEVADRLVLSVETVRSHIKHVMRKLHVSSRRDAVALAQRMRDGTLAGDATGTDLPLALPA
jgi:DNA-binding NarL/FixJ family response regulator